MPEFPANDLDAHKLTSPYELTLAQARAADAEADWLLSLAAVQMAGEVVEEVSAHDCTDGSVEFEILVNCEKQEHAADLLQSLVQLASRMAFSGVRVTEAAREHAAYLVAITKPEGE